MKILHVINTLDIGGAERLLTNCAPIMQEMGHDVTVLLLRASGADFEQNLEQKGVKVCTLRTKGSVYNPLLVCALRKWMKGYDIVHAHLFPTQYWVAAAHLMAGAHSVLVTTEHSTNNTRGGYALTTWIDRQVYRRYNGVICISDGTADFMSHRCPLSTRMVVIENGIPMPDLSHADEHPGARPEGVPAGVKVLLQVARFSDQKNQDCVIRALKHLPEDVHVVFAGAGDRLEACKALAAQLGMAHRAHFLGSRGDIDALWEAADLGVMSSHWEGFGLAAVEGMAHGRPVLASNVKGLAEVIGDASLLFAPDNEQELAQKIQNLLSDDAKRAAVGEQCRKRAEQFSIRRMTERYVDFYNKLTEQKTKA